MSRRWLSVFESDLPRLVGDLEALVRLESPTDEPDRVSHAARWVRDRLRERGVAAELRPCPPRGEALLPRARRPRPPLRWSPPRRP